MDLIKYAHVLVKVSLKILQIPNIFNLIIVFSLVNAVDLSCQDTLKYNIDTSIINSAIEDPNLDNAPVVYGKNNNPLDVYLKSSTKLTLLDVPSRKLDSLLQRHPPCRIEIIKDSLRIYDLIGKENVKSLMLIIPPE